MTNNRFMIVDNHLIDRRRPFKQAFNVAAVDTIIPHGGEFTKIKLRCGAEILVKATFEQTVADCQ